MKEKKLEEYKARAQAILRELEEKDSLETGEAAVLESLIDDIGVVAYPDPFQEFYAVVKKILRRESRKQSDNN